MERFRGAVESRAIEEIHRKIVGDFRNLSQENVIGGSVSCDGLSEPDDEGYRSVSVSFGVRQEVVLPDWRSFRLPEDCLTCSCDGEKKHSEQIAKQRDALCEYLCENCEVHLSTFELNNGIVATIREITERLVGNGFSHEEIKSMAGELIGNAEKIARRKLTLCRALDAISTEENITVDDAAVMQMISDGIGKFAKRSKKAMTSLNMLQMKIAAERRARTIEFVRRTIAGESLCEECSESAKLEPAADVDGAVAELALDDDAANVFAGSEESGMVTEAVEG
jgi:FKBP-type peptidyl-prolyl cis-trans isomerase (trigger factor)